MQIILTIFFLFKVRKSAAESPPNKLFNEIVAVTGLEGNEIDRHGGGESFVAIRHLNWLNVDKLQRYTLSPSRTS